MQPSALVDVLLINPPYPRRIGSGSIPPINLCYLASALRAVGANPVIVDLALDIPSWPTPDGLSDRVKASISAHPGIRLIGIGPLVTATLKSTRAIMQVVREFSNAKIIVGGPLCAIPGIATAAESYLGVDAYVAGDGETPVAAIWRDISAGQNIAEHEGVGLPGCAEPRPFREPDLDVLGLPARDLLIGTTYRPSARRQVDLRPTTASFLSRGCPYACAFCAAPLSSGRTVRRFSPARMTAEIADCKSLGYEHLIFYDDCLFVKGVDLNQRVLAFADSILSADWTGGFQLELRCDAVVSMSDEAITALQDVGCEQVSMGIEKGDAALLATMRKRMPEGLARSACERLAQHSIRSAGTFILGGPGETVADLEGTAAFARSLPLDFAHFSPLALHPGTVLFSQFFAEPTAWLEPCLNDDLAPFGEVLWRSEGVSLDVVVNSVRKAYSQFYTRNRLSTTLAKTPEHTHDTIRATYSILQHDRAASWGSTQPHLVEQC